MCNSANWAPVWGGLSSCPLSLCYYFLNNNNNLHTENDWLATQTMEQVLPSSLEEWSHVNTRACLPLRQTSSHQRQHNRNKTPAVNNAVNMVKSYRTVWPKLRFKKKRIPYGWQCRNNPNHSQRNTIYFHVVFHCQMFFQYVLMVSLIRRLMGGVEVEWSAALERSKNTLSILWIIKANMQMRSRANHQLMRASKCLLVSTLYKQPKTFEK